MATEGPFGPPFESPGRDAWRSRVDADLRGADFQRRLVHRGRDGLKTRPLYTRQDVPDADQAGMPGQAPWVRGRYPHGRWQTWQCIDHPDPQQAAADASDELENGAHGLFIVVDATGVGQRGVRLPFAADLDRLLAGLPLVRTWLALDPGADFMAVSSALMLALRKQRVPDSGLRVILGADPVGTLARTGTLAGGHRSLPWLADLSSWCARSCPGVRAATVDTRVWSDAGATDIDSLALALSTAVTYLRAMEADGLWQERAFNQISFRLAMGTDVLQGVAKIRALRGLWARVAQACGMDGDPAGGAYVHAVQERRSLTRRDPWVNLLRSTAATFSGAIGGADAVTTLPYDAALGVPDAHARRLARNTQSILMAESHLGRVADPGGGSFFIESRTNELMETAWARFQQLEAAGGVITALCDGTVRTWLDAAWAEQQARVATRRRPITGVSEYPQLDEPRVQRAAVPPAPAPVRAPVADMSTLLEPGGGILTAMMLDALSGPRAQVPLSAYSETLAIEAPLLMTEPLPQRRLAEPFERLRDRGDASMAKQGQRPQVFLATLGPVADHAARSRFTQNLLASGGLGAADPGPTDSVFDLSAAFVDSGCRVAVICGSDAAYIEHGEATARALDAAGATAVWLAGRPREMRQPLGDAGVRGFLHKGCDAVAVLEQLWAEVST